MIKIIAGVVHRKHFAFRLIYDLYLWWIEITNGGNMTNVKPAIIFIAIFVALEHQSLEKLSYSDLILLCFGAGLCALVTGLYRSAVKYFRHQKLKEKGLSERQLKLFANVVEPTEERSPIPFAERLRKR